MSLLKMQDPMIRRYTGINERSMRYIQRTGEVEDTGLCRSVGPRILDSLDANVSYYLFSVQLRWTYCIW